MSFDPPFHWWATVVYLLVLWVSLLDVTRNVRGFRRAICLAVWPLASTLYFAQTFCDETDQCFGTMPLWSVSVGQLVITVLWFTPIAFMGDLDMKRKIIVGASLPLYLWLFLFLPAYTNAMGFYQ